MVHHTTAALRGSSALSTLAATHPLVRLAVALGRLSYVARCEAQRLPWEGAWTPDDAVTRAVSP